MATWARLSARNGTLVDADRWTYIQTHHQEEVEARLSGKTPVKRPGGKVKNHVDVILIVIVYSQSLLSITIT